MSAVEARRAAHEHRMRAEWYLQQAERNSDTERDRQLGLLHAQLATIKLLETVVSNTRRPQL